MALTDHFSSAFLDFRPSLLATNSIFNLFVFLPSNRSFASASAQNSRTIAFRRRPLHLTFLSKPSSSNFDVISTHEHSDGSLLFRFGDPTEVAKNAKIKESNTIKDKAETQGKEKEGYDGVKVLLKYREADTAVKMGDRGVTTSLNSIQRETVEAGDECNPTTISSESIDIVEEDNGLNVSSVLSGSVEAENGLNGSLAEIELLDEKVEAVSSGSGEEENGLNDSSLKGLAEIELLDKEVEAVSSGSSEEENGLNGSSLKGLAKMELLDEEVEAVSSGSSEEENGLNDRSLKGLDEIKLLDEEETAVSSGSSEEENGLNDSSLKGLPEVELLDEEREAVLSGLSVQDTTNLEKIVDEEQTDGLATPLSLVPGRVLDVSDAHVFKASLETVASADESAHIDNNSVDTEVQNEIILEGNKTVESEFVSLHPSSEPAVNPSQVIEDQNSQIGTPYSIIVEASGSDINDLGQDMIVVNENELDINCTEAKLVSNSIIAKGQASEVGTGLSNKIVENVQGSDEIQLPIMSPQMEADPMLEEPGTDTMEKSTEANGAESLTPKHILGSARTEVDNNVQNGDLIEPSAYEVTRMESTESATRSNEILLMDLALSYGAALLPHPSKVLTGGEDAYFVAGQTWLGVADGVCHWSMKGTSPGYFAKELIKTCERLVSDGKGDSVNSVVELLNLSVAETSAPGSSTILMAYFDGQALHVANIGDSGFIILRHGTVYKKSSPMSHAFHFPLQVETGEDASRLAEFYRVELEEGDLMIIATDGLLDNLYDLEISSIVTKSLGAGKDLEEIAQLLGRKAQLIGGHAYGRSPFADDAQAAGYSGCTGGKLDDVAVILSVVRRRQSVMRSQSSH